MAPRALICYDQQYWSMQQQEHVPDQTFCLIYYFPNLYWVSSSEMHCPWLYWKNYCWSNTRKKQYLIQPCNIFSLVINEYCYNWWDLRIVNGNAFIAYQIKRKYVILERHRLKVCFACLQLRALFVFYKKCTVMHKRFTGKLTYQSIC